ncbi:hypothetical protein [Paraburkholderia humisilvae]
MTYQSFSYLPCQGVAQSRVDVMKVRYSHADSIAILAKKLVT